MTIRATQTSYTLPPNDIFCVHQTSFSFLNVNNLSVLHLSVLWLNIPFCCLCNLHLSKHLTSASFDYLHSFYLPCYIKPHLDSSHFIKFFKFLFIPFKCHIIISSLAYTYLDCFPQNFASLQEFL